MHKRAETYSEFSTWCQAFISGALDILIIQGSAGVGKSSMLKKALYNHSPDSYCWLEGRISAVCLFEQCYKYKDRPIYIDDVDSLYSDRQSINLLKLLCQTEEEKHLQWLTKTTLDNEIPKSFYTTSKACLITNHWKTLNKHVGAVEDRGLLLNFTPTKQEVHQYAITQKICCDQILDFMERHMPLVTQPSLRYYRNAQQLLSVGLAWQNVLLESFNISLEQETVLQIESEGLPPKKRTIEFVKRTGKSKSTYYRIKRELAHN